jgi:hypothetical protein
VCQIRLANEDGQGTSGWCVRMVVFSCAPTVPQCFRGTDCGRRDRKPLILLDFWWAHKGSNLGPLPCEGNALPLSYAPGSRQDRHGSSRCRCEPDRSRDLRRTAHRCQAMNAARQKFYFSFSEIYGWFVSSRLDERGTFWPVVAGHEAGCDGRKATRVFFAGRTAPLRTAKSCGPDTPTLASSRREMISPMIGARKPGPRGARRTALKALCREGRMIRLNLL